MTKNKIVLVPFPFDDLSTDKVRPAICLTDPIGIHRHVVLAFITSRIADKPLLSDFVINVNDPEFVKTGLRVSSMVQLHRLLTVTTSLFRRELGTVSSSMETQINNRLRTLFKLK
jgi:mRNA interferase MazF